jgi:hypothetical protein
MFASGGMSEVGWAVVSALAVMASVGFVIWMRKAAKKAFMAWFSIAIDTHVEPKFEGLKQQALDSAAAVKEELRIHTAEEGAVVRLVVQEEVAPLRAILDSRNEMFDHLEGSLTATQDKLSEHMAHDDAVMERVGADLRAGQAALLRTITRNQDRDIDK